MPAPGRGAETRERGMKETEYACLPALIRSAGITTPRHAAAVVNYKFLQRDTRVTQIREHSYMTQVFLGRHFLNVLLVSEEPVLDNSGESS